MSIPLLLWRYANLEHNIVDDTPAPALSDPSDISGLTLWLKSDAGLFQDAAGTTPATSDNDPVGLWQDQSGNNFHVSQSSAPNRPILKLNVINGLLPAISFSGGPRLVRAAVALSSLVGTNTATIFIVQYQNGGGSQNTTFMEDAPNNTNRINAHLTYDDVLYFDFGGTGVGGRISVAQPVGWDNAWHIIELYRSGAAGEINVDNNNAVSTNFTDDLDNTQAGTFSIGAVNDGTSGLSGYIAALLFYNRALNVTERAWVYNYLNGIY